MVQRCSGTRRRRVGGLPIFGEWRVGGGCGVCRARCAPRGTRRGFGASFNKARPGIGAARPDDLRKQPAKLAKRRLDRRGVDVLAAVQRPRDLVQIHPDAPELERLSRIETAVLTHHHAPFYQALAGKFSRGESEALGLRDERKTFGRREPDGKEFAATFIVACSRPSHRAALADRFL
jgi:hypothetical protein